MPDPGDGIRFARRRGQAGPGRGGVTMLSCLAPTLFRGGPGGFSRSLGEPFFPGELPGLLRGLT
jgi:hypothetical protein